MSVSGSNIEFEKMMEVEKAREGARTHWQLGGIVYISAYSWVWRALNWAERRLFICYIYDHLMGHDML